MSDPEEIRWIKSTANELNNLLQVISDSGLLLEEICDANSDTEKYFAMLHNAVERATKVTRTMVDRVSGSGTPLPPPPTPTLREPSSKKSSSDVQIFNPHGSLELVMIVDDEDFVIVLAERVLADAGYRVITARDGFEAIEFYRKRKDEIALVILDFTMPVMDGADVFKELQEINPKVPVVLSSGFTEQDQLRNMLSRGLLGFIPKPYNQQKLLTQIRATLDSLKPSRPGS
ncbi:MAG: response regulator [Chthoniobacteraceae bacterium]